MNTLLTPGDVPKSKPKTNLWLNHCALLDFIHKEQRHLALGLPIKVATSPARFAGRQTGRSALRIFCVPFGRPASMRSPQLQNQSSVTWRTDLTTHSPRLEHRRNEDIRLKLSWKLRAGP
jgi:hypothetical protein